jgi:hypothetical protein
MDIGYAIKDDPQSARDVFLQSADFWARKVLVDNITGVLDLTDPNNATLTPATDPSWVSAAYDGKQLVLDGNAIEIDTSSDVALTFDASAISGLVDGQTYSFRVQGAAEWVGDSEGKSFDDKPEFLPYKVGIPRKTKRRDLIERVVTAKGKMKSQKFEVILAILGLKDASIAAAPEADPPVVGYKIGTAGSNPSTYSDRYEFIFQTRSVNNKVRQFIMYYCDISADGSVELDTDGHKMIGFVVNLYSDPCREDPDTAEQDNNYYMIKEAA